VNLSTRARVGTGENAVIAGFILTGSTPKNIVLRGLGPSLTADGQPIPGRLSDPKLSIFDNTGALLVANDDWGTSPERQQIVEKGLAPSDSRESATLLSLQPGSYTAVLNGVGGEGGIGLVELYDVEQNAPANAANLSTRGRVQTGDNVMIGGFIVGGSQQQRLMVRAIGPSLAAQGVADPLRDPMLEIVDSSGTTIASNDNWRTDQATEIEASRLAPSDDAESAIIGAVGPGSYTAIVRGAGGSAGVALVEVYRLSP